MPEILSWHDTEDPLRIVQQAAQALAEGQLVAFPTETVYGIAASAWIPEAVDRLAACKERPDQKPMALALGRAEEVLHWLPDLGKVGWRLARRCFPGPVTLVSGNGMETGLSSRLPESVRHWICPTGTLGLRVPAHEVILQVLSALPGPLVLTSANPSGTTEATTADEVARTLGDRLALIIDDGPSPLGRPSSVVVVEGENWRVVREGIITVEDLQMLAACWIVFVCTGNTCRSPLAEALCKNMLAERIGCPVAELPRHGFVVCSAGLAATRGDRAAPEAIEAARELGADLQNHVCQPVTRDLVFQADYLVTMTQGHLQNLLSRFPYEGPAPRVLCPDGADVPDPVGCDLTVYRECAFQLQQHLQPWVQQWVSNESGVVRRGGGS
jgi:tRNA threonylcarbamoyl adenosine modification protein (Sua5/YciO/YrdC/YwlC family)